MRTKVELEMTVEVECKPTIFNRFLTGGEIEDIVEIVADLDSPFDFGEAVRKAAEELVKHHSRFDRIKYTLVDYNSRIIRYVETV